jgi:hypothetical protein
LQLGLIDWQIEKMVQTQNWIGQQSKPDCFKSKQRRDVRFSPEVGDRRRLAGSEPQAREILPVNRSSCRAGADPFSLDPVGAGGAPTAVPSFNTKIQNDPPLGE